MFGGASGLLVWLGVGAALSAPVLRRTPVDVGSGLLALMFVSAALLGAAIPIQLLAERLARARRVNPDTLGRDDPAQAAAHA